MLKFVTAAALTLSLSPIAHACPVLNGDYILVEDASGSTFEISFATKVENGIHLYSLGDSPFLIADGQTRELSDESGSGKARVTCQGNVVELFSHENGKPTAMEIRFTKLNENQIQVDAIGDALGFPTGLFTKQ